MRKLTAAVACAALMLVTATGAEAKPPPLRICVPEGEGKPIKTPKKGVCAPKTTATVVLSEEEEEKLAAMLPYESYEASGVGGKPTIRITGANVQVVSGSGSTTGPVNGAGNLVIGYDEHETGQAQTGSHNLVLGKRQTFTSYGGLVAGEDNKITGIFASVLGGLENVASGENSSVAGGSNNIASGPITAIGGGEGNEASALWSSISGGLENKTEGVWAWVGAGRENVASAQWAAVGGGRANTGSGSLSFVSGGVENRASGSGAWVGGGSKNKAGGLASAIFGGSELTANEPFEAIP